MRFFDARHVVSRALAALAMILALCACAQTAPSDAPPMENGVYVAQGICFGEGGCPWKHWRAHQPVDVRERLDTASPVIATVAPGEWVEAVEGQLRMVPKRGVVRTAHDAQPMEVNGRTVTPRLEVGDAVYLLQSEGEGDFVIWHQGAFKFWHWPEDPEQEARIAWDPPAPAPEATSSTLGWWVRVKLANGRSGWVKEPSFECMGPLAGDQDCRG